MVIAEVEKVRSRTIYLSDHPTTTDLEIEALWGQCVVLWGCLLYGQPGTRSVEAGRSG